MEQAVPRRARPGRRAAVVGVAALAVVPLLAACGTTESGVQAVALPAAAVAPRPAPAAPVTSPGTTVSPDTVPPTTEPDPVIVAPTFPEPVPVAPLAAPIGPASPGSSGPNVAAIQQRLLDLGFWVDGTDGRYGYVTNQAVMAFQKYNGVRATGTVDQATANVLNFQQHRVMSRSVGGNRIEVDKKRQLLFVVRDGTVVWTVNSSTGSGKPYVEESKKEPGELLSGDAQTPPGRFTVQRQRPDGWWEGELGRLYRPKYFNGGIAVHGASNVPAYPASHGCVRVSVPAMDFIWAQDFMPLRTEVWVHEG